jgi:hypothetical protein
MSTMPVVMPAVVVMFMRILYKSKTKEKSFIIEAVTSSRSDAKIGKYVHLYKRKSNQKLYKYSKTRNLKAPKPEAFGCRSK